PYTTLFRSYASGGTPRDPGEASAVAHRLVARLDLVGDRRLPRSAARGALRRHRRHAIAAEKCAPLPLCARRAPRPGRGERARAAGRALLRPAPCRAARLARSRAKPAAKRRGAWLCAWRIAGLRH